MSLNGRIEFNVGVSHSVHSSDRAPNKYIAAFVYLFCIALDSDCWTQRENVHGFYGVSYNLTLNRCYETCVDYIDCVAIDWDRSNHGKTCWILTSTVIGDTITTGVVTHYDLDRACLSKYLLHTKYIITMPV